MADPVPVQAGWAIWSKHPGTRDDYSVLASSGGPLSPAEFARVLMHFAPGNPPAENSTSASLPWVMLSRVGVAEKTYLGVSLQVPTESVDGTGRPISSTSYICVPYEDVVRVPVSYRGLSDALRSASLPSEDGALVPLAIQRLDPEELAREVLEFGPNVVATTAALLLSGPVTIIGPDFPDSANRLRFLDAVAALLPYGLRASYTAATWSDTAASEKRFRIVFANRARDEASQVMWRSPARVPPQGSARHYLQFLQRITGRPNVTISQLAGLIAYLARDTQPGKFEHPERAVASLAEFFRVAVVGEAIDDGTATTPEIRLLFSRGQDGQLTPDRQQKALARLISAGDAQDWPVISQRFGVIADGHPKDLLTSVAVTCRRLLWSTAPKAMVGDYLGLVAPDGRADELLAKLMAPPTSAADLADGLDSAGRLLAEFVVARPASYPKTQQALSHNAAVGAALLAHLSASREAAGPGIAVEWLEPVLGRILPPFRAVLGDASDGGSGGGPKRLSPAEVDDLSRDGGQLPVRYLLRAASCLGRLHVALPGVAPWLARDAMQPGATVDRRFWNEVAMELTPATAAEAAWLDVALLATGNDPRSLLAGKFAPAQFNRDLCAAWQELTKAFKSGREADDLLTGSLVGFLGRYSWRSNPAQSAAVTELTARLTADGARPQLKAIVLDPVEALRQLPRQATAAQIAEACARAYADGLGAEQGGQALAQSGVITSGPQAADVLEQLHRALSADLKQGSGRWQQALATMFADGAFGDQTARQFATVIAKSSRDEITYHLYLLRLAADGSTESASSALTDADADFLDRAREALHDIIRDVRKRQGGGRISRGLMGITGRIGGDGGGEGSGG